MRNYWTNINLNLKALNKLLLIMFYNNVFKFNENYYIQKRGLAMGSVCRPTIANIYLYILEKHWININKPII